MFRPSLSKKRNDGLCEKKIGVYRRTKMRGQLGGNKGVTNCGERKWGELPNPTN